MPTPLHIWGMYWFRSIKNTIEVCNGAAVGVPYQQCYPQRGLQVRNACKAKNLTTLTFAMKQTDYSLLIVKEIGFNGGKKKLELLKSEIGKHCDDKASIPSFLYMEHKDNIGQL